MMDGVKIAGHFLTARYRRRFLNRESLETHQKRELERFRKRVLEHVDYYKSCADLPLSDFPIMDKPSYQDNFAGLNTLGISYANAYDLAQKAAIDGRSASIEGITIGMSTGTSGNRGLFLVSPRERLKWLGTVLAKAVPDVILRPQRIALMLAANSDLYKTVRQSPHYQFRFFDLFKGVDSHLSELENYTPTILIGTAQALTLLAQARKLGNITFNPRKIISGGEVLDPQDQRIIEDAFGLSIDQIYQCTEGFFGMTCPHGSIHLTEDCVLFEKEWVDQENGKFVPLITDFSRDTQAMVRYRMNDILTELPDPCPCGSPLTAISRIEGRCDDCFVIPNSIGADMTTVLPDVIRNTVVDCAVTIDDFRILQLSPTHIEIQLPDTCHDDIGSLVQGRLETLVDSLGCMKPKFKHTRGIEVSVASKLRRVRRCFDLDEVRR